MVVKSRSGTHNNTTKVRLCAREPSVKHSVPSNRVLCSSVVCRRPDHKAATLSLLCGISSSMEVRQHDCQRHCSSAIPLASMIGHRHLPHGREALLERVKESHSPLLSHTSLNCVLQFFANVFRNCSYHHEDLLKAQEAKTTVTDVALRDA